jgi:hypothetical protein
MAGINGLLENEKIFCLSYERFHMIDEILKVQRGDCRAVASDLNQPLSSIPKETADTLTQHELQTCRDFPACCAV